MNEKGFSMIEGVVSVMIATLIMSVIQLKISDVIKNTINNNTASTINEIFADIEENIILSCTINDDQKCNKTIDSLQNQYTTEKMKVTIWPARDGDKKVKVYAIYSQSNNEEFNKEEVIKRTASRYGSINGDTITSVLGWWSFDINGTLFEQARGSNKHLCFYQMIRLV